jgi:hypothetical protein
MKAIQKLISFLSFSYDSITKGSNRLIGRHLLRSFTRAVLLCGCAGSTGGDCTPISVTVDFGTAAVATTVNGTINDEGPQIRFNEVSIARSRCLGIVAGVKDEISSFTGFLVAIGVYSSTGWISALFSV